MALSPSTNQPLTIGVDGGGTKTAVLLADSDGIVGRGGAGSSNYQKIGFEAACAAIQQGIAAAFAAAALPATPPAAVCLGLSGVDRLEDQRLWEVWLRRQYPDARRLVVNDAELPLAAGTPDGWGVGVICGTGAICVGRNRAGRMHRADGWGFVLGDDGSGYAIGRSALRAVLRAYDGRGPATHLTEGVLAHWGLSSPEALLDRVYIDEAGPAEIASLAAVVDRCAEAADPVATAILAEAGRDLAHTIAAVVRALGMEAEPVPCALAGSVVTKSRTVAAHALAAVAEQGIRLAPVERVEHPVIGALRLAQRIPA